MRPQPGFVFSIAFDSRFAVGMVTHDRPRLGSLVWIAEETFDHEPTAAEAQAIGGWRWPVFFPLGAALRRKLVSPVTTVAVPRSLQAVPIMRSGWREAGWRACAEQDGQMAPIGTSADPSLPIYQVVNDTKLREMLATNWHHADEW